MVGALVSCVFFSSRALLPINFCACPHAARVQDDEVGDGTTSVTVLCGELLREAEKLVNQRLHPQVQYIQYSRACFLFIRLHPDSFCPPLLYEVFEQVISQR